MAQKSKGKESVNLTAGELLEMDELLAMVKEEFNSMDATEADGFMTAIELLPVSPSGVEWVEEILAPGIGTGTTGDPGKDKRLKELLTRRRKEIGAMLKNSEPFDPIYFDVEDESGKALKGKEAIVALEPFAMGFLEAAQKWPGLLESESDQIASALLGIFRHLPEEALGDLAETKAELDKNSPLENLPEALSDLASCVALIGHFTKGYDLPSLDESHDE